MKEIRNIDAGRRNFRPLLGVTVSSNKAQHILTWLMLIAKIRFLIFASD
jgi:hypothetical protein